ncbi:hypothetical protein D3C85_1712270 [compost metagenome]
MAVDHGEVRAAKLKWNAGLQIFDPNNPGDSHQPQLISYVWIIGQLHEAAVLGRFLACWSLEDGH